MGGLRSFLNLDPSFDRCLMSIIVTIALIIFAAFVSTSTSSADAFIAVLFVGPFAAVGLYFILLIAGWIVRAIRSGSEPR
ncbi:hypothetical protein SL003B_0501 [Polymorphum gilvum SL003B-26A1]|uniref:Transmembrane protein n=2 Tax=Polymorphum TaxID=991903 RepID=F2J3V2_POLGS|nr:hypothetical protein SL003B_0501 [Polymorphum gilvum SL003B-26A1]